MFACHPHPPKGTRQLPSITLSRGALDSVPPLQGLQTWEEPIPHARRALGLASSWGDGPRAPPPWPPDGGEVWGSRSSL